MTGIYLITNTVNGKCYIGQSVDIERRWGEHKTCKKDYPLYHAFEKYGLENFKWDVLLECPEESLDFFEKAMISGYNSIAPCGYNLKDGGANGRSSEETKAKISAAKKGKTLSEEHCKNISAALKGKPRSPFSEETRQKISNAKKGKTRAPHTAETKQKISEANKGKTRAPFTRASPTAETKQKISDAQKLRCAKMRDSK